MSANGTNPAIPEAEKKAGHPPALKVGGVRIAQRTRRDSEETPKPSKESKSEKSNDDHQSSSFSPFKTPVLVTGVMQKVDQQKDYPKEEIIHAHEKPVPTHQPAHQTKPAVIQQPRK